MLRRIKQPTPSHVWPESWKLSYLHDLNSVYLGSADRGYRIAYRNRMARAIAYILDTTPPGARVLDLAAGQGNFTIVLAELGYRVTWNDLRSDLVDYVRLKTDRTDIEFQPGDLFDLSPERVGRFDAIVATEIIEHVAHPDALLSQLSGLLAPHGVIALTTPNGGYFRNALPRFSDSRSPSQFEAMQFKPDSDGHIFLLHPDEWASLAASAGLAVKRLEFFNNFVTNGYLKTRYILPFLPTRAVDGLEGMTTRLPAILAERLHVQTAVLLLPVVQAGVHRHRGSAVSGGLQPASSTPSDAHADAQYPATGPFAHGSSRL